MSRWRSRQRVFHFHKRSENLLSAIEGQDPHRELSSFPSGMDNEVARAGDEETASEWVQRMNTLCSEPRLLRFMPDSVLVGTLAWDYIDEQAVVREAHFQAVVFPRGGLEQCLKGAEVTKAQYLRVDYEPWNLGKYVFPDPVPHVHTRLRGEPRFAASMHSAVPHVDFIELILRNYYRDAWNSWADRIFKHRVQPRLRAAERMLVGDLVKEAFKKSQHLRLATELADVLELWKAALQEEKVLMSRVDHDSRMDALSY